MLGPVGIGVGLWGRTAGFSPFVFGDLIAGYEADYGITLNGGNVSAWAPRWVKPGQTPAALSLTQGTASKQPLYVPDRGDGKPTVSFDGTDDSMSSSAVASLVTPGAYSAVLSGTLATGASIRILTLGVPSGDRLIDLYWAPSLLSNQLFKGGVNDGGLTIAAVDPTSYRTFSIKRVGLSHEISRDGVVSSGAALSASGNAATNLSVGSFFGGAPYSAIKLSSMWVYSSDVNTAATSAAMKQRWPNYG